MILPRLRFGLVSLAPANSILGHHRRRPLFDSST